MPASQRLYQEIARTINRRLPAHGRPGDCDRYGYECVRYIVEGIANDLKEDNIHFDTEQFLEACGLEDEE